MPGFTAVVVLEGRVRLWTACSTGVDLSTARVLESVRGGYISVRLAVRLGVRCPAHQL